MTGATNDEFRFSFCGSFGDIDLEQNVTVNDTGLDDDSFEDDFVTSLIRDSAIDPRFQDLVRRMNLAE